MNFLDAQKTWNMSKYREYAYKTEADPLYLQYQREEVEKQVWLDKIAEIKNRHPYPEGCTLADAKAIIEDEMENN